MTSPNEKQYGLIMSAPMILAYLKNLKGQTRRLKGLDFINRHPDMWSVLSIGQVTQNSKIKWGVTFINKSSGAEVFIRAPYGCPGSLLYFKEKYAITGHDLVTYAADGATRQLETTITMKWDSTWKSSMYMRRAYSRFTGIPVNKVRIERIQDISQEDAKAEGVESESPYSISFLDASNPVTGYRLGYMLLWNQLNAESGHFWDHNDYVWVYEFPKYEAGHGK